MALKFRRMRKPSIAKKTKSVWFYIWYGLSQFILTLALLTVIFALGFFAYQKMTRDSFLPLHRIIVARQPIYADIASLKAVVIAHGQSDLMRINVRQLVKEIETLGWVESASVTKVWPDGLRLDVQERIPILRWGNDEFLDKNGFPFALPKTPALAKLFSVNGPKGYEKPVLNMYQHLIPYLKTADVEVCALNLDARLVWHVVLPEQVDVIVGRDHLNQRIKKLILVNNRILKRYQKYIHSVDLRYQGGFSIRWKEGVKPMSNDKKS